MRLACATTSHAEWCTLFAICSRCVSSARPRIEHSHHSSLLSSSSEQQTDKMRSAEFTRRVAHNVPGDWRIETPRQQLATLPAVISISSPKVRNKGATHLAYIHWCARPPIPRFDRRPSCNLLDINIFLTPPYPPFLRPAPCSPIPSVNVPN